MRIIICSPQRVQIATSFGHSVCQIRTSQEALAHAEQDIGHITLTENQVAKLDRTLTTQQSVKPEQVAAKF